MTTYNELLKNGLSEKGKGFTWLQNAIDFLNSEHEYDYYNDCNLTIVMNNVCKKLGMRYSFNQGGEWNLYK